MEQTVPGAGSPPLPAGATVQKVAQRLPPAGRQDPEGGKDGDGQVSVSQSREDD